MNHTPTVPANAASAGEQQLPPGEYAALIGLDWGDKQHAVALRVRGETNTESFEIEHCPQSLHRWLDQLKERFGAKPVAVAVEASRGAIISALLEHSWLCIYPVHPATSRRFSTAFTPSGAKDDMPDAHILLDILRCHRSRLRMLLPHEAKTRRLSLLVEARRTAVDRRTMFSNQLTSLLKGYFPQALELTGDKRYSPLALAFLARWPDLESLKKAQPQSVRRFYYAHQVRRPELIEQRIEAIRAARALSTDRDLCDVSVIELKSLLGQISLLQKYIAALDLIIADAFAACADAPIFNSLPGAGAALAPPLSVLFGEDRARWSTPVELQTYYGIAPVIERTGRKPRSKSKSKAEGKKWIHWRWNAPRFARQTLVEWAGVSVKFSSWAKAYYYQQKARHKSHSAILRALAFKWLRILWRCWKDRTPYSEALYLAQIQKRNPLLFALIKTT